MNTDMNGESEMTENGSSLNATEIAVGSLLAGGYGGRGGYGGGAWDGGWGGYGGWGAPNVNACRHDRNLHAIDRNAVEGYHAEECTRALNQQGQAAILSALGEQNRSNDRFEVLSNAFQSELRTDDRLRDISNQIADNAAAAAKCCCDIQLGFKDLAIEAAQAESRNIERFCELKSGQAEIKATMAANKEIAELRQQLTVEQTLNRQYCCPPPVKCVDPCCNGGC